LARFSPISFREIIMALATQPVAGAARFDARARRAFLDHLAMTANVAASARAAGIAPHLAYATRRRNAEFASQWQAALTEGFARLESALLAEALSAVSGKVSDATLKSRAQKHRLGLALLAMHRASVRGGGKAAALVEPKRDRAMADKVAAKIRDMHNRMLAGDGEI
jgi:hypothetical protein